jgi:hypothetical protein
MLSCFPPRETEPPRPKRHHHPLVSVIRIEREQSDDPGASCPRIGNTAESAAKHTRSHVLEVVVGRRSGTEHTNMHHDPVPQCDNTPTLLFCSDQMM